MLLAETDFVPIALALHRVTRGASALFVLCDPLHRDTPASGRGAAGRRRPAGWREVSWHGAPNPAYVNQIRVWF